jgi:hypothetical protein
MKRKDHAKGAVLLLLTIVFNAWVNVSIANEKQIGADADPTVIEAYKPSYLLFGADGGNDDSGNENSACDLKFQLSLKTADAARLHQKPIWRLGKSHTGPLPFWLYPKVILGYLQKLCAVSRNQLQPGIVLGKRLQ